MDTITSAALGTPTNAPKATDQSTPCTQGSERSSSSLRNKVVKQPRNSPKASDCVPQHDNKSEIPFPAEILNNTHSNKGSAFTQEERDALHLHGFLPPAIETLDLQIERCEGLVNTLVTVDPAASSLMKFNYLTALRATNETLFYALLQKNICKYMPYVYTPTVGLGCQQFSHIFNQGSEGLFLSLNQSHAEVRQTLQRFSVQNGCCQPSIIVVTDGSRILGLGDLGANGMGIPVGKLALYVAVGGFHPRTILPITLDLGTNNEQNLADPLYLGLRQKRPSSEVFYQFTDNFMDSVQSLFPSCVIQFEDFENKHCFELLDRNRNQYRCFNDDIQGTGVVAAAGVLSAMKFVKDACGLNFEDHRIVFYGFGSATAGVSDQIVACLHEKTGVDINKLRKMFYMVDSRGLCTRHRGDALPEYKLNFARDEESLPHGASLEETIDFVKPTALIGLSGQGQTFTKLIVSKLAAMNDNPIIFALSNPTSKAECLFSEAMEWTNGKVVWAAGSPMDSYGDRNSPQGNNLYAFPGIGFGSWLCQVTTITDEMMIAATNAISDATPLENIIDLYPPLDQVAEVSDVVAAEVMRVALERGLAECVIPATHEGRLKLVREKRYNPIYGSAI